MKLTSDFRNLRYTKGIVLNKINKYNETIAAFDKVIETDPHDFFPWKGKGNFYMD